MRWRPGYRHDHRESVSGDRTSRGTGRSRAAVERRTRHLVDLHSPENRSPSEERYARYVLGVLTLVYVFNFLDRQIVSILAERIKDDLGISDAQIGFLYGTAFAVFYAVFGIPLGRLADVWDRRRLIAIGLAFWSTATALSGFARTFGQLAAARIGVGVGEASASPAAFSLLSDVFPPARRATALAIYSSGIYIGAGLGLGLGGLIVDRWDRAFTAGAAPLGLDHCPTAPSRRFARSSAWSPPSWSTSRSSWARGSTSTRPCTGVARPAWGVTGWPSSPGRLRLPSESSRSSGC